MCFRNLVIGPLTVNPGAGNGLIEDICPIRSVAWLFAARYVSDMAVPYRVVMLVGFFFDPNLDNKRVGVKFGRPISTLLRPLRYQTARF